jgi:hypothetical protein
MQKYPKARHQGHASPARDKALPRHWLISPAWRYALSIFNLLEEERRRSLEWTMERIDDVKE